MSRAARPTDRTGRRPAGRSGATPVEVNVLVGAVVVLCAISLVMVYSASSVTSRAQYGSIWAIFERHALFVGVGAVLAVLAARIPMWVWRDRLTVPLLVISFASLVALLVPGNPLAADANGATRWLRLGPVGFQPSDLAKLALVLWLAGLLTRHAEEMGTNDLLRRAALVVVPLALLVLAGNDLGTTLLLGAITMAMWFLAGAPLRDLGIMGGAMALVAAFGLTWKGFRLERITAFVNPELARRAADQAHQSQIGFASGGLFGVGPGASRAKWGFLSEAHTDFILAVIGEELGLVGTLTVVGALAAVVTCGIVIGMRSRDPWGRLVAWGISVWIGVQAIINVTVAVGAAPTKGIALPFVSSGGTAMVTCLVAVGILLSVSRASRAEAPRRSRTAPPARTASPSRTVPRSRTERRPASARR